MSITLINSNWQIGTGNYLLFRKNGEDISNERVLEENPHKEQDILWKCIKSGSNLSAAGGFNHNFIPVSDNKTYRLSVWMKRNHENGRSYFGCDTRNTLLLNGTQNNNPYFWFGNMPELNKWYLFVAFIHPNSYTGTNSPLTGIYDPITQNKVVSFNDFKMKAGTTEQTHRTYLFYVADIYRDISIQYIWDPRFEEVTGFEPSIEDLLVKKINNPTSNISSIYNLKKDAIVSLNMKDGDIWYVASGFFITNDGYIATCAHCVLKDTDNESNYNTITGTWNKLDKIYATIYNVNGQKNITKIIECDIIGFDGAADVAIIKPKGSASWKNQTYISWGQSRSSHIGDPCYVLGNPAGIDDASISHGIIRDNKYGGDTYSLIESIFTDCSGVGGNSGGVIIDANGKALGIFGFGYGESGNLGGGTAQYIAEPITKAIIQWHRTGSPQRSGYGNRTTNPTYPNNQAHNKVDNNGEYIKGYLGIEIARQINGFIIDYMKQTYSSIYNDNIGCIAWIVSKNSSIKEDDLIIELEGIKIGKGTDMYNLSSVLWFRKPGDDVVIKKYSSSDKYKTIISQSEKLNIYDGILNKPLTPSSSMPIIEKKK